MTVPRTYQCTKYHLSRCSYFKVRAVTTFLFQRYTYTEISATKVSLFLKSYNRTAFKNSTEVFKAVFVLLLVDISQEWEFVGLL
jgi:hypothetical protein